MKTESGSLNKVASITLAFWIMKVLATTLGETTGDLLAMTLNIGYSVSLIITSIAFLFFLFLQLRADKFHTVLYWLVIVGTTTVGTEISDFMDRTLGLGYTWGSVILLSCLLAVLFLWYKREAGIRVFPVTDRRVELFYWLAILISNSLGTAFGDYLSDDIGLSYVNGALVTAGIIGVVAVLHYFTKLNEVLLFWIAFIFTRPFGATFGDLLTKPMNEGGLDLGTIPATLVTSILLGVIVFYTHRRHTAGV